ncbi:hypothetical protein KI688_013003 [Linnemannia hyalina]|uniref:Uncharacterized protein n=1 Tax=Linnemannia hyalina TaxID=64524 RepID=A0A9P8BT06_9FUNG|nr:hypothetical protein KI688_013003 [Linnemannia hyalina]
MGKPSTPHYARTGTRSSAAAKQQSSLSPKVLVRQLQRIVKGAPLSTIAGAAMQTMPIVNVSDPTPDAPVNDMTSDIDSRSFLISTAPVHDLVPDNITYFEDAYTHLRSFKPKVATVVPHPNANFKAPPAPPAPPALAVLMPTPTSAAPTASRTRARQFPPPGACAPSVGVMAGILSTTLTILPGLWD